MFIRQLLPRITTLALLQFVIAASAVLVSATYAEDTAGRPRRVQSTGILTDRLSKKDLQRWRVIEQIVLSQDKDGQPLYPTLRGLYEWAETSGHAIYIELPSDQRVVSSTAGNFSVEKFDPSGERHIGVVRLYLSNIDAAYVGSKAARENGFIPLQGLRKEARYAEVLGHELAHMAYILSNLERTKLVRELVENTNELLLNKSRQPVFVPLGLEMLSLLDRRDALLKELETQAEAMEEIVWRELYNNPRERQ
ncbi:MAG TPA: hypothetical protein VEF04_17675 [Blastocatellia bacterium]|nr:hypothetical protein [Blastocatellia bacterium]